MGVDVCCELLEIIDQQELFISKQSEIIAKLIGENLEKENVINELIAGIVDA